MDNLWHFLAGPFLESPAAAFWPIAVGGLASASCALLGCYLVLRRMSLLGDAISHAVLPGLVVAFLFSGTLAIGPMFLGALALGLLTTLLVQTLHRYGGVPSDASMGVVFTSLFALGVVLLNLFAANIHLDTQCVLEGLLDLVGLPGQGVVVAGVEVPRQAITLAPVLAANLSFVVLLWKELKLTSFDPALATSMGIPAGLMHYLLMAMVALTTVASFEAVGSILVVAMLIAPAATAQLLCDRLSRMIATAVGLALLSTFVGYWFAAKFELPMAGMMAVAMGGFYVLAVAAAPRYGILSTLVRDARMSIRIVTEDLLAMLYRIEELSSDRLIAPDEAAQAVGGGFMARWSLFRLVRGGLVRRTPKGLALTDSGRERAIGMVRSHRLWETYLVEYLGLPLDHVHAPAERMEHFIDEDLRRQLATELGTTTDPHGREIPAPSQ